MKSKQKREVIFKMKEMTTDSYVNENDPREGENLMRKGRTVRMKSVVTRAWGRDMAPNVGLTEVHTMFPHPWSSCSP